MDGRESEDRLLLFFMLPVATAVIAIRAFPATAAAARTTAAAFLAQAADDCQSPRQGEEDDENNVSCVHLQIRVTCQKRQTLCDAEAKRE